MSSSKNTLGQLFQNLSRIILRFWDIIIIVIFHNILIFWRSESFRSLRRLSFFIFFGKVFEMKLVVSFAKLFKNRAALVEDAVRGRHARVALK